MICLNVGKKKEMREKVVKGGDLRSLVVNLLVLLRFLLSLCVASVIIQIILDKNNLFQLKIRTNTKT